VLAISMDDPETLAKFKKSLNAPFPFIADPEGKLTRLYQVKTPVVGLALRYTFVVGEGRKILKVDHGKDSIDPSSAIVSCDLSKRPPRA
jgi:peroxiredoxin